MRSFGGGKKKHNISQDNRSVDTHLLIGRRFISGPIKGQKWISINTRFSSLAYAVAPDRRESLRFWTGIPNACAEKRRGFNERTNGVLSGVKLSSRQNSVERKARKIKENSHQTVIAQSSTSSNNTIHGRIVFLGILYRHATAFCVLAGIYYRWLYWRFFVYVRKTMRRVRT